MYIKKSIHNPSLTHLVVLLIAFLSFFYSCDFSTHEYYSYQSINESEEESIYVGWHFGDRCFVSVPEGKYDYDNVTIVFPSDNIPIFSEREMRYEYVYNDSSEIIDSTMWWLYILDVAIDDERIFKNDSLYVSVNKGDNSLEVETLFLKKDEVTFEDRLPLFRMH